MAGQEPSPKSCSCRPASLELARTLGVRHTWKLADLTSSHENEFDAAIDFARGAVQPDGIVSEVVSLEDVPSRLEGIRGANAGPGPKVQVDPRLLG
jgi:hypothetical protein